MKRFAATSVFLPLCSGAAQEAPTKELPAFDVVSLKLTASAGAVQPPNVPRVVSYSRFRYFPTKVTCGLPLIRFLQEAYSYEPWRISGPEWLREETFELTAIMPEGTRQDTARLMLRRMLADRFGLKAHRESRKLPVYALVVAKNGPKLKETADSNGSTSDLSIGRYNATGISMATFAEVLTGFADRSVLDETGLKGRYTIALTWTPDYGDSAGPVRRDVGMLAAIENGLGLRLEKRTMPVDVLVIDHIDRVPTPN